MGFSKGELPERPLLRVLITAFMGSEVGALAKAEAMSVLDNGMPGWTEREG